MKKEKKHTGIKILFVFIIIVIGIYLYGRYINPYNFTVKERAIYDELLPENFNGLKIAHFSDLHFMRTTKEEQLKKVVNELNKLNPDIVIFTGDLLDQDINEKTKDILIKQLKKINAKFAKFAIIGDYDEKYINSYSDILTKSEFTILDNSSKLIYYNNSTPINFIGLTNKDKINELFNNPYYNISLFHKPDLIKEISKPTLAFAGHSLGGQIRIPFMRGIRKTPGAETYFEEYYQIDNQKLYISNGIGTEKISIRLFNTPSISLYRLYKN